MDKWLYKNGVPIYLATGSEKQHDSQSTSLIFRLIFNILQFYFFVP